MKSFHHQLFGQRQLRPVCGSVRRPYLPESLPLVFSRQSTARSASPAAAVSHPEQRGSLGLDPRPSDSTSAMDATLGVLLTLDASQGLSMATMTVKGLY